MTAARELLDEGGYGAVTMEAVAARAGVGKPTVYRRWSTRSQLVLGLDTSSVAPEPFPDTGSLRDDLVGALTWLAGVMAGADRAIQGDQIGEMIANRDFAARVWERRIQPDRDRLLQIWQRAEARGDVRAEVDGADVLDDLVGAALVRVMIRHESFDRSDVEALVDRTLTGVLGEGRRGRPQPAVAGVGAAS